MNLVCCNDASDMGQRAAALLAAQIAAKPDSVLGLATGGTMLEVYRQLVLQYRRDGLTFSRIRSVNLDEYVGLSPGDPNSYAAYMRDQLWSQVDLPPTQCHIPQGTAPSVEAECARYEALIASLGGVDLQLLGLGRNGHIGFNEPQAAFVEQTHCVTLSESTRKANARFFPSMEQVPRQAITMGVGTIMKAGQILLCVSGEEKAAALRQILCGPVTPAVPGSILQRHPNLTVMADGAACSLLPPPLLS